MKKLSITLENRTDLSHLKELGIDEVIVACLGHTFSALHEFSEEEIKDCIKKCHASGMQICVLMNRLYAEEDIAEAQSLMLNLIEAGADYVMVADPGMIRAAKMKGVQNHIVYRSETLMTSAGDASFWMEQGLESVMIPSLLTAEEVLYIARSVKNASVIIHGHTMMSVSKRRLFTSYANVAKKNLELNENRSLRLKENKRDDLMPVYENAYAAMIYTDFMQESFVEMKEFAKTDLLRFEIDTAFMDHGMIDETVRIYRGLLDGKEMEEEIAAYRMKYADAHLSDGYYGQKTIK